MTKRLPRILEEIRATKETEIARLLETTGEEELFRRARASLERDPPRPFRAALLDPARPAPRLIAEIKKASPSRGLIRADFDPPALAQAYERGGASALSCLTDETYFQGSLAYIALIRAAVALPVLRKDFLLHRAQAAEARAGGADAVLLIARMLSRRELKDLRSCAKELGMDALGEAHDEADLDALLEAGADLIGVNNRDLDTFEVDPERVHRLRERVPAGIPFVAESGIGTPEEMRRLGERGIAAALVGESLMREANVTAATKRLLGRG